MFTAMIGSMENGCGGVFIAPGARFHDDVLDRVEGRATRRTAFRLTSDVETLVDVGAKTIGRLPLAFPVLPRGFFVGAVDGTD